MTEQELGKALQKAVDHRLSAAADDPWLATRVLQQAKEEPKMKKKLSLGLVLALVTLLLTVTALATGLIFSPRVDEVTLAERTLAEKYDLTPAMLGGFFRRDIAAQGDATTVTYTGWDDMAYVLGTYTVTVQGGQAEASWSRDGVSTEGGLDADAWGAAQLAECMRISGASRGVGAYYDRAIAIAASHDATWVAEAQPDDDTIAQQDHQRQLDSEAIQAAAKLSEEDMCSLARSAVTQSYQLSEKQLALMEYVPENSYYAYVGEQPCYHVYFWLAQDREPDAYGITIWQEKDGIYIVSVNVETGTIEDLVYDSALFGNG